MPHIFILYYQSFSFTSRFDSTLKMGMTNNEANKEYSLCEFTILAVPSFVHTQGKKMLALGLKKTK